MIVAQWKLQGYFGSHPECKRTEFIRYNDQDIEGAVAHMLPEIEAAGLTAHITPMEKPNHHLSLVIVQSR